MEKYHQSQELREPPHDEACESAVLSCCLQYENRAREYASILLPEHFCTQRNQQIFKALLWVLESGIHPDNVAVVSRLMASGALEEAGGISTIAELSTAVVGDVGPLNYVPPILDTYARRRMMLKASEALVRLGSRNEPLADILSGLEDEARECSQTGNPDTGFSTFADIVAEAGSLEKFLQRGNGEALSYPWPELTEMTRGGMKPGQLIVLAGPPGRGKSALALNIALHVARQERGVALFSLEMDRAEQAERLLAMASGVDSYKFQFPNLEERGRIRTGAENLLETPVFIRDEISPSLTSIRNEVKRLSTKQNISLVIVDYLQLVESKSSKNANRAEEVSRISRGLKRMAMELKVRILALSQLNRDAGKESREPELRDLRESGSIEQDANLVLMMHYTRNYDLKAKIVTGELDLILRKQRNGSEGRVQLTFHAPTGKFFAR